jgi:thermostable 8-oxoguanine DNA glycosylase
MQFMSVLVGDQAHTIEMPDPATVVCGEVLWGEFDNVFTAAFWCGQTRQAELLGLYQPARLGRTLREEMAACLLGGYGMKAEIGLAAFDRLREEGLLEAKPDAITLESALARPFEVAGRNFRYRYPRQKAKYLAACLPAIDALESEEDDLVLRDALVKLPGIGPKTASWIVRNQRSSDAVAIIDIHVLNAGCHIGLFPETKDVTKQYPMLEAAFLQFAAAMGVRASVLDNVIWAFYRRLGHLLRREATATPVRGAQQQQLTFS